MSRYVPPGPLGMGGAPLGNLFDRIPEPVAAETMEAGWSAGIRPTAREYNAELCRRDTGAPTGRALGCAHNENCWRA